MAGQTSYGGLNNVQTLTDHLPVQGHCQLVFARYL